MEHAHLPAAPSVLIQHDHVYARRYGLVRHPIDGNSVYDLQTDWPKGYPSGGNAGIYALFCDQWVLRYIGKASLNSCIAARLGTYFVYENGKGSKAKQVYSGWSANPRYVLSIPVRHTWEAPSLEEYLIGVFQPPDNTTKGPVITKTMLAEDA